MSGQRPRRREPDPAGVRPGTAVHGFEQPTVSGMRRGLMVTVPACLTALAPGLGDVPGCRAIRDVISAMPGQTPVLGAGTVFFGGSVARMIGELDLGCGDPPQRSSISRKGSGSTPG